MKHKSHKKLELIILILSVMIVGFAILDFYLQDKYSAKSVNEAAETTTGSVWSLIPRAIQKTFAPDEKDNTTNSETQNPDQTPEGSTGNNGGNGGNNGGTNGGSNGGNTGGNSNGNGGTPASNPSVNVFPSNFDTSLSAGWSISMGGANTASTSNANVHSGSGSLRLHYADTAQPLSITHNFSSPQFGIVTVWFYDALKNPSGSTIIMGNSDLSQVVSLGVNPNLPDRYFYRAAQNDSRNVINSMVARTKGWHKFELISTDQGSFGRIDGISLAWVPGVKIKTSNTDSIFFGGVNTSLKGFTKIGIFGSWASGDYYWDDLSFGSNPSLASSSKDIDRYFLEKFVAETQPPKSSSLGYYRSRAVYALSLVLLNRTAQDRQNAVSVLNGITSDYSKWGKTWLSESITYTYALAAQRMWGSLDTNTKNGIQNVIASEADFFKYRLDMTRDHPNDPDPFGGTYIKNFSNYVNDTKAEEISNKASVLAAASLMFPQDSRAKAWDTAAKTYAFHSGSRGESYGGLTSKNVYYGDKKFSNYLVSNHSVTPYPSYAITGLIAQLANGALFYKIYGKSIPSEFQHNMTQVFDANQAHVNGDFQLIDQYINNDKDIFGRKDDWGLDATYYTTGYAYECLLANKCNYKSNLQKYQITIARDYLAFPMDARVKMPWRGTEYTYEEKYWISGTNALAHATSYLFSSL